MERRDVGYFVAYFLSFVFVAIIGISFSVFVDKKQQVEVKTISVFAEDGIEIGNAGEKDENSVFHLSVKSPKVGTKPVSGELDTQTDIPYTVSNEISSEGAYAAFSVLCAQPFKIVLYSCSGVPDGELDNVKIAVDGSEKKPHSLSDVGEILDEKEGGEKPFKFTVLVWLDNHAGDELVGSKIEVGLRVEYK